MRRLLILVGCASVLLLSAWTQARVIAGTEVVRPIRADGESYVSYAWNLREFHVFSRARTWRAPDPRAPQPDKLTLPGYPVFLALFMDGKPDRAFVARATTAQAALGVATCALVLMIAFQVLPVPWALAAGAIAATTPHLATINTYLLTEGLFCFLLAAFVYAAVRTAMAPDRLAWWMASALLLALASHVRPQLQLLHIVLLLALVASPPLRRHWRKVLASVVLFCALMAPWQLRNAAIERPPGEPDLLATTLYHGSFPDFMYRGDIRSFGSPYRHDPNARDHGASVGQAIEWIRAEFARAPGEMTRWYLVGKPTYFLSWGIVAGMGDVFIYPTRRSPYLDGGTLAFMRSISHWLHVPLMVLGLATALVGSIRPALLAPSRRVEAPLQSLSIMLLVVIFLHMIGAPFPRYGIPFRWIFQMLAMFPLARIVQLALARRED